MKKKNKKASPVLTEGQLWKTDKAYIQVRRIGKLLIDYRMLKEPGQKAVRIQAIGIERLRAYLEENAAVLVN